MSRTKIKICGLFRPSDAEAVNRAMPDYAGFVFCERSRRNVSEERVLALREALRPSIQTVGVFVDAPPDRIAALCRDGAIGLIQLHGSEDGRYIARLRALIPGVEIWQAFRVRTSFDCSAAAGSAADRVLLDSGGGTGRCFDWVLATRFPRPFVLAGGLAPGNLPEAIARLCPWAVDLSSGVETNGVKDSEKIFAAVRAARGDVTWYLS